MTFEFFIAKKYLRTKKKEGFISMITFLSIAGVTVGVMALVVVIAVMSGAQTDFRKRILGLEPHMHLMSQGGKFKNYEQIQKKCMEIEGVKAASPIIFSQAAIRTSYSFAAVFVRGIDPNSKFSPIQGYTPRQLTELLSETRPKGNLPGIILGKQLANNVGALPGDKILLLSPKSLISPTGSIPSMKRFVVKGTFESGMDDYDRVLAFVNLTQGQKIDKSKNRVDAIGLWVDNVLDVKSTKEMVMDSMDTPFFVRDWMEVNKSFFSALKLEKAAMFIILTLIILVAAFNITSALIRMVMEKTKDIAVLKAMGATHKVIRRIFIIEGTVIGIIGTFTGTVSGIGICYVLKKFDFIKLPEAYPFSTLPIQLEVFDVIVIAVSTIVICFLSTLYPSYKASKMDPVEAIRYG